MTRNCIKYVANLVFIPVLSLVYKFYPGRNSVPKMFLALGTFSIDDVKLVNKLIILIIKFFYLDILDFILPMEFSFILIISLIFSFYMTDVDII